MIIVAEKVWNRRPDRQSRRYLSWSSRIAMSQAVLTILMILMILSINLMNFDAKFVECDKDGRI